MDLLPNINVDRMLKDIIGGIDRERVDKMAELYINKYNEDRPELVEVPDFPWMISIDDLEKYNANGYNEYLEKYADITVNCDGTNFGKYKAVAIKKIERYLEKAGQN
jgi:hypothetical protein